MATFPANQRELIPAAKEWTGLPLRHFLLPWLLVLLLGGVVALEWVYSPVEVALGRFMVWSQGIRPEAGRGWDLNREGMEAMRSLDELTATTRQRQAAGAGVTEWVEVSALLDSFQVFSVSPDRFINLYSDLPPALQQMLLDPVDLLKVRTGGRWQRVFFSRERGRQLVYLVDPFNVVLLQGDLTPQFLAACEGFIHSLAATLADLPDYPAAVTADQFFQVLAPEGPVILNSTDLRWIASLEGRLVRVGLSLAGEGEIRPLAFETVRDGRSTVHRYWLDEAAGAKLYEALQTLVASQSEGESL